ncbi:MAG: O-antigen ligase family protein [Clostridia bacterium]|nr:O-antigen ligase family protein [Clostridia bacterium]
MQRIQREPKVSSFLLAGILFFMFFVDFSVISVNAGTNGFGLQMPWFLCMVFVVYYVFSLVRDERKLRIKFSKSIITKLFIFFIAVTIIDLIYDRFIYPRAVVMDTAFTINGMIDRAIPHTIYLIYIYFSCAFIANFLTTFSDYDDVLYYVRRYAITWAFFFITIWGIYQFLTTFGLIPYIRIFNNNPSEGFTYERFRNAHRTSSVFAEPSEYGYYLCFMTPIVVSFVMNRTNLFTLRPTKLNKIIVVGLLFSQILLTQAFSIYVVLPLVLLISFNMLDIKKRTKVIIDIIFAILAVLAVSFIAVLIARFGAIGARIEAILNGSDSSVAERFRVLLLGLSIMRGNPLLGMGYGTFRAMDLFSGMLAYFGILGMLVFLWFLWRLHVVAKEDRFTNLLFWGYCSYLLAGCAGNSLFEFMSFWMIPFFIIILSRCKTLKMKKIRTKYSLRKKLFS